MINPHEDGGFLNITNNKTIKTTIMKQNVLANTLFALCIGIMCLIFIAYTVIVSKAISTIKEQSTKVNCLYESYRQTIEENEMLWNYIDNVDTFKSLDDAVMYRDSLICELQFLDE